MAHPLSHRTLGAELLSCVGLWRLGSSGLRRILFLLLFASSVHSTIDPGPQCTGTAAELVCGSGKWFGTGGVRQDYRGCAPKTCKEFPTVNHGHTKPRGGRVEVGESITVFCDSGYELDQALNTSSTPKCQSDCTFEQNMGCRKIKCAAPGAVPNSEVVGNEEFVEFGDEVELKCNVGYRPSTPSDLPTFNDACETSFFRKCLADGSMSNADTTCISVQCPAYDSQDVSLTCTDQTCGPKLGSVVATVTSQSVSQYLHQVEVVCNPGYEWNNMGSNRTQCSATCNYLPVITGRCVPLNCPIVGDIPNSDFQAGMTSLPFGNTLTVTCDEGTVSAGQCTRQTTYSCSEVDDSGGPPSLDIDISECVAAACDDLLVLPNVDTVNMSRNKDFGTSVTVSCREGYRAVPLDDPPFTSCDNNIFDIDVTCGSEEDSCGWTADMNCVPVECDLLALTQSLDGLGQIADRADIAFYSDTFTVECITGYYVSNVSLPYLDPAGEDVSIQVTCGSNCTFPEVHCVPALCGAFELSGLQNFTDASNFGRLLIHEDVVEVTCTGGMIPEPTEENYGTCQSTFTVRCGADGMLVGNRSCVMPECGMGCQRQCEYEPDSKSQGYNGPGMVLLDHGTTLQVDCVSGHRASLQTAACEDPTSYAVSCQNMCLVHEGRTCQFLCEEGAVDETTGLTPESCDNVFCDIGLYQPQNSTVFPPVDYLFYEQTLDLACDPGFRIWSGDGAPPQNVTDGVTTQTLRCNAGCNLDQVHCVPLLCPAFEPDSNQKVSGYNFGPLHHLQKLNVACKGTLIPNGILPADCGQNFTVECFDGQLLGNAECKPLIRHDCPEYEDENGVVLVQDENLTRAVTVTCNTGFVAYNLTNNGSALPTCGMSEYSAVCDRCDFDVKFACVPLGCGRFVPRLVDSGPLYETVSPDRYMLYNESVNVSCPAGFRMGGDQIGDPSWLLTQCLSNCSFEDITSCQPLACEAFVVPLNSAAITESGQVYNSSDVVVLHYNETLILTCNSGYVLANTTDEECEISGEMMCQASGKLRDSHIFCEFRECGIDCEVGTRHAGVNGTSYGCDISTDTCPPTAPRTWVKEEACLPNAPTPCRQPEKCTPVRCEEFSPPSHGSVNSSLMELNPEFNRALNVTVAAYGDSVHVSLLCFAGFAPESEIKTKGESAYVPSGRVSFMSVCRDDGSYNYSEACLADTCLYVGNFSAFSCGYLQPRLVENGLVSEQITPFEDYTLFGESVTINCPEGFRVGSRDLTGPMSVETFCLDDCTFGSVPICTAITCGNYSAPPNSTVRVRTAGLVTGNMAFGSESPVEVLYNQSVLLTCNVGYILESSDDVACEFEDEIQCLSNGMLDSEAACKQQSCRVTCSYGTRFCPGSSSCLPSDPNSWIDQRGCSAESSSRCDEKRGCTPVQCDPFQTPSRSEVSGLRAPNTFPDTLTVKCQHGFMLQSRVPQIEDAVNGSFYASVDLTSSNFTMYNSTCGDDGNWSYYDTCVSDSCVLQNGGYHCAVPQARNVEDMMGQEMVLPSTGYISLGSTAIVKCPMGYRPGNRSIAASEEVAVACLSDCQTASPPICLAIECSPVVVPATSSGRRRLSNGTTVGTIFASGDTVTLLFGQSLVVTCDFERTIANSSRDECVYQSEVTCMADGSLVNSNLQCERRDCEVKCNEGTRYGGPNGTANNCDGNTCLPSAPDSYSRMEPCVNQTVSRCFEYEQCLPVACSALTTPDRGTLTIDPPAPLVLIFNESLNVTLKCDDGYAPDSAIRMKGVNTNLPQDVVNFVTTCSDTGFFDRIEQCLSTTCFFVNGSFSCGQLQPLAVDNNAGLFDTVPAAGRYLSRGETVNITCPEGYRMGSRHQMTSPLFSQTCQDDCNFLDRPTCMAVACGNFTIPDMSTAQFQGADGAVALGVYMPGENISLLFGEKVLITCSENFTVNGQCQQVQEAACQADGTISNSMLACTYKECQINCTVGTRYGGPTGNSYGCNGTSCFPSAPKSYPKGIPCANQTLSACFEVEVCQEIVCDEFVAPINTRTVSVPAGSYATYQDVITVACNAGFIRKDQVGNASLASSSFANVTHLTMYTTSCADSGEWDKNDGCVVPSCVQLDDGNLTCGQYVPRFTSDGEDMEAHPLGSPFGFTKMGASAHVQCPEGYRLNSSDATLPRAFTVACQSDCAFQTLPVCTPVTCGMYTVPPNSQASLIRADMMDGGTFNESSMFRLMYGDTVTVTCSDKYTIAGTSTCDFQATLQCLDSGLTDISPSCQFQSCSVTCTQGTRFCANSTCSPSDPTTYVASDGCATDSPSRCSNTADCTPVRCNPYTPPENSTITFGLQSTNVFGDTLTVTCDSGFFVEQFAMSCGNSYDLTCQDDGSWLSPAGVQGCVAKYCIVETFSASLVDMFGNPLLVRSEQGALGASYYKQCDECDTPSPSDVMPVCQSNCSMDVVQTCVAVTCAWDGSNQTNALAPATNTAECGGFINVGCAEGYRVRSELGLGECAKTFEPECQQNGVFSLQRADQCVPATCPPLISVDSNVANISNYTSISEYGTTLTVRCATNHGAGGVPGASYTAVCGQSDVDVQACSWSLPSQTCERISCGDFVPPTNAHVVGSAAGLAGDFVTAKCDPGWRVNGTESCQLEVQVLCNATGLFATNFSCEEVTCPPFSSLPVCTQEERERLPAARVDEETPYGGLVELYCEGELDESGNEKAENVTCLFDCALSPHTIQCQTTVCAPFVDFNVSSGPPPRTVSTLPQLPDGGRVIVECEEGFELVNEVQWPDSEGDPPGRISVTLWPKQQASENLC